MKSLPATKPALAHSFLTPAYDQVVRFTTRERRFKGLLLDSMSIANGERLLDIGCGTGTLLNAISRAAPAAEIFGLDADPAILKIAARKMHAKNFTAQLVEGRSTAIPFGEGYFDHVVSTLFFHHLLPKDKQRTLEELFRVLRPGGMVHIVDWGKPTSIYQRFGFLLVQLLDGFATTREHLSNHMLDRLHNAGFKDICELSYLRTVCGTLRFYRARKSS